MNDERRCEHCKHWRYDPGWFREFPGPFCYLDRPLKPCADYEREVGADDERGE